MGQINNIKSGESEKFSCRLGTWLPFPIDFCGCLVFVWVSFNVLSLVWCLEEKWWFTHISEKFLFQSQHIVILLTLLKGHWLEICCLSIKKLLFTWITMLWYMCCQYFELMKRVNVLRKNIFNTGKSGGGWDIGPGKASPLPNPKASTLKETFFPLPLPLPAIYKYMKIHKHIKHVSLLERNKLMLVSWSHKFNVFHFHFLIKYKFIRGKNKL